MKLFTRIFVGLCYLITLIAILLLTARQGYLDKPLQDLAQFYLNKKGLAARISNFHITGGKLTIEKITVKFTSKELTNIVILEFKDLKAELNLSNIINKQFLKANIAIGDFAIITEDNKEILSSIIIGDYEVNLFKNTIDGKIEFTSGKILAYSNVNSHGVLNGFGSYTYHNKIFGENKIISAKCNFGSKSSVYFTEQLKGGRLTASGKLSDIPIMLYRSVKEILPNNKIVLFLDEYVKAGNIFYGEFNLDLNKHALEQGNLTRENLSAKFQVTNLEYKYNKDFPSIKDAEVDIAISGSEATFLIHKSYSGSSILANGIITLNWTGIDTSTLIFQATSHGSVKDLIDFIPPLAYENMKNRGIDLKDFNGIAYSVIKLKIPISPEVKNSYKVSTIISDASISIFKNKVLIKDLKLNGLFTGDRLSFTGTGKINNFNSTVNYEHHINNSAKIADEFSLKIQTMVRGQSQPIGLIALISGDAIIDMEYKGQKNGLETLTAKANLQDTEFYIDKVAIHKTAGARANFSLNGTFEQNAPSNIEMKLIGDNNLDILGHLKIAKDKYEISLPIIKHKETDIKCNLVIDRDNFHANISGATLDLSEINMMEFLQKQQEEVNSHLRIDIDSIKMKNNILFREVKSQILCNKMQCFSGYLDSKIGDKFFRATLDSSENKEQWDITSNDAGKVFKALGLYNKMSNGTMLVTINLKKNVVHLGEVIPVINGTFVFRDFLASDTSFLTKIVSFISLPGLIKFITNNQNIHFADMSGNFSYINNMIRISKTSASGSAFDFTMSGSIDTDKHQVRLKGVVTPSIYGINNLMKNVPILGSLLSRGRRKGIIIAPYSISQSY
jgi:hypothetical protein